MRPRVVFKAVAAAAMMALASGLLAPVTADAEGPGGYDPDPQIPTTALEISVVSGPDGVTIYISVVGLTPGDGGSPGAGNPVDGPDGPICTANPMNIGNAIADWIREGLEAHPGTIPWWVLCDNGYAGVAWVPIDAPVAPDVVVGTPPAPAVDPAAVAASLLDTVPLPPIAVGANPGIGLVAMTAWFWVDGYDGSTLSGSRTLGPTTVEVEITPKGTRWSFGDGAVLETTSLGQPYPAESDLRHTYEQSSQIAGGTFEVTLDITFDARYRVNDGPWLTLAPVTRTFTRDYPVQQLQSVLTSSR